MTEQLVKILASLKDDPVAFNRIILRRPPYWYRQEEMCKSVVSSRISISCAGNGVGKSFCLAGIIIWFLATHPGSRVLSTAPSNQLLVDVLWSEVRQAWNSSVLAELMPNVQVKANPQRIQLADGWDAVGWASDSTAKMSGRHRGDLLWVVDEASDVPEEIWQGIWSTNPSRLIAAGNPLTPSGEFFKLAQGGSQTNVINISSLESPDINIPRSKRGMADADWLAGIRERYGENSPYWKVHVLGQFAEDSSHVLIPSSWLDHCPPQHPGRKGQIDLSVDLSGGTGNGDESVIIIKDDNGVLEWDHSRNWSFPQGVALRVSELSTKYRIEPKRIVYDAGGLGMGFGAALEVVGIKGARRYFGGESGVQATNIRGECALALRDRLNPALNEPFSMPPDLIERLKPELAELRYSLSLKHMIKLEAKEEMKKRLGRSPDLLDSLCMSFRFN